MTAKHVVRGTALVGSTASIRHSTSMRARTTESSQYIAQQKSVLADVEAQVSLLQGERASLDQQIGDLEDLASVIRKGVIELEGRE